MRRIGPLVGVLIVATLVAVSVYVGRQRDAARSVLSGTFESRPIAVAARIGGRITRLAVAEGDMLKPGQTILELEATPDVSEAQALASQAREARYRLQQAQTAQREDSERTLAAVRAARANLQRLQAGSRPEEIAAARARFEQAESQYRDVTQGPRPDEIAAAENAVREASAALARIQNGISAADRRRLQTAIDSAQANEALATQEANRMRTLVAAGAVAQKQADQAETARVLAVKQRQAAEAELAATQPRNEDIVAAQARVGQARNQRDLLRAGSRPEAIAAARGLRDAAVAELNLALAGSRTEDVLAAKEAVRQTYIAYYAAQSGSGVDAVRQASAAAQAADALAHAAGSRTAERDVRSPRTAYVERILVSAGDLIQPGQTVARLSDTADLYIRVYVPESRLARVSVGQAADLRVDGIGETIAGQVESIATQGEFSPANLQTPEERGRQAFGVRIRLKSPDARVKPGMAATVRRIGDWVPGE